MTNSSEVVIDTDAIGDAEFHAIRDLMYRHSGVALNDGKRALVCSRLARRLRALRLPDYGAYLEYLNQRDPKRTELQELVNCLTTNKTDFLRESHHFDFLRDRFLPAAMERAQRGEPRRIRIWSSACSQGDEPYTIAMAVLAGLPDSAQWDVRILATDINTEVLRFAERGEYPTDRLAELPEEWRRKYFQRAPGGSTDRLQVRAEVKRLITFRSLNLMGEWPIRSTFDVIFCRNVLIYFDRPTQERLLRRMTQQLRSDGYLILGHSENSPWLAELYESAGQTIYHRRTSGPAAVPERAVVPATASRAPAGPPRASVGRVSGPAPSPPKAKSSSTGPTEHLIAGQYGVLDAPGELVTVLGSCVAACLYDPETGIGGMNHFMLPVQSDEADVSARYGVHAMELLITAIMKRGGHRHRLVAKAFGGANLLRLNLGGQAARIGELNIEFLRKFLRTEEIRLVAEKLGGFEAMRVQFSPHTGRVIVRTNDKVTAIGERERQLLKLATAAADRETDVTLFV